MNNPFKNLSNVEKGAIAAGGIAVVWFVVRQHKSSAGTAASASSIDPLTGLPVSEDNQPDPLTGETYLAEAQQYGSVQAAEEALAGAGLGTLPTGGPGEFGFPTGSGSTGTQTGVNFPDNATWAQAVEAGLTDIGYSSTDVAAALGRYLGHLSLTPAQASIVQDGLAEYGNPPVGTFRIILKPSGPTGSGGTAEVTVPDVATLNVEQAESILKDAGLNPHGPAGQKGVVHTVTSTSPAAGTKVKTGTTVTLRFKSVKETQPKAHKPGVNPPRGG